MNTKQIQYALALSETLSFSQVAEQLGISQPALSKQIQHLEKELGVKLFDRSFNPVVLTPAGEYFIRNARELVYKEEQLHKALARFQSGERGRLVIGISPFRCMYLIPRIVKKVRDRFPGVQVVLHEIGSDVLRKEAAEGKYDFAVVNLPVDESVLEATPIEPDTLVLAVPNALCATLPAENGMVDFAACRDLPFVVVGQNQEMRQLFDKLCASADFHPNIVAEVVGLISAWALTHAGVGATVLPLQFVSGTSFDENITLYTLKNIDFTRQPMVVRRKGQFLSEYARYAIDLLTEGK